jgi:tRNA pseudouridine55 synthase
MVAVEGSIEGILIVDKPSGITSHDVVERVRGLLNIKKVGHTGTLDPFAAGVMVICLGRATRVARYFEGLDKAYKAVLKLGVVTDTGDGEGTVLEDSEVPEFSPDEIESVLEDFRGRISQQAPAFSAIKVAGERLYAKARRGEKVSGPVRKVTIGTLQMESIDGDRLKLFVECSKGTYIRSLAYDIGRKLGCGAHCKSLVRTRVGPFSIEEASGLEEIVKLETKGVLDSFLGLDEALGRFLEAVRITKEGARLLSHGGPVEQEAVSQGPKTLKTERPYRALDSSGRLVALVEAEVRPEGVRWVPSRVLASPF